MSLILPRRLRSQPQYPAPLDKSNKFHERLTFAYSVGRGPSDAAHGAGSVTGAMTYGVGQKGKNVKPADSSSYIAFANNPDYNITGGITVIALVTVGGTTVQQHVISKSSGGGGSNTPWAFGLEIGGYIFLNRANAGFRVWQSGTALTTGRTVVIAATQGADISVAPKFYVDGVLDSVASTSLYGGSGSGAPNSNTETVKIGNRADLGARFFGLLYDGFVLDGALSDAEVADFSRNIWAIWKAPERRIFTASATTSYTLTADSFSLTFAGTDANLEYNRALSADPASFSFNVVDATLKRGYALTADSASLNFSGADAALKCAHVLQADSGTLELAAADASLEYNRVLQAGSATIQFDVADATLTHAQPGSYTLTAEPVTLGFAVTDASLKYDRKLTAEPVELAFNGADASLRYARAVIAEAAQIAFNLNDATLTRTGGPEPVTSIVERTAVFQRSKSVTVRFN
ncbi:Concanavalin A-like lectin/glucanases superfamily protein [Nitrosospira multiformis]|uniref:Concanavalin A-like lectin/glucanases superfamily protein n=1 Tax=Nitrosospira multiformis TaxID=1231 RepID=A0A1H8ITP8_9PROT|nr:LamG-like jellyroll fold domain-containing protein [Nitrosospira multiformis]SEN71048.1 Concanavalin A-like lectin/glucanases superfamily protein [Nitrosospira multiformis]